MASLAINPNVLTKLLKLSFMTHKNGKLPTFRSFNCTLQTQKDWNDKNTFQALLPKNKKNTLRLPILFVRSMTSSFLIRSWNQRLWRLLHNHCKTFGSSLPPKAKRYPNMLLKVAKKNVHFRQNHRESFFILVRLQYQKDFIQRIWIQDTHQTTQYHLIFCVWHLSSAGILFELQKMPCSSWLLNVKNTLLSIYIITYVQSYEIGLFLHR